jgi:hypothetical protein
MALPEIVSPQESSLIGADPLRVVAGSRLAKPSRSDARGAPQENRIAVRRTEDLLLWTCPIPALDEALLAVA